MCGTCAYRNETVAVDDIARNSLTAPFADLCAAHGIHGGWSTPIRSTTGTVLGAFALYYSNARRPGPGDQRVIDRSIHLAKLAIEQDDSARALRDNAKRAQSLAREQTALQRVATSIAAATPSDEVFALVAEQVARLLKADAGYVLRFEDELRYRNVGAWARGPAAAIATRTILSHEPDDPLARLRGGADAARRFDAGAGAGAGMLGMLHRIAAPVIVDGKPWGVVLALRGGRREFPREDERRIDRFAQLTSVTVANAEAHARLAMLAQTDPLTKLANRRTFDERLKQETERAHRHTRALSVVLVDVDQFKMINDRFGHAAGDNVLVHLADNLRAVMRSGDLLARIGGDELAMILPDCRPQKAALVTRRMLAAVQSKPMAQPPRRDAVGRRRRAGRRADRRRSGCRRTAARALARPPTWGGLLFGLALGGAALETVDAATGVDELLATRVERVAVRADLHVDLGLRGARLELVAARAADVRLDIFRMDVGLHGLSSVSTGEWLISPPAPPSAGTAPRLTLAQRARQPHAVAVLVRLVDAALLVDTRGQKRAGGADGREHEHRAPLAGCERHDLGAPAADTDAEGSGGRAAGVAHHQRVERDPRLRREGAGQLPGGAQVRPQVGLPAGGRAPPRALHDRAVAAFPRE